MLNERARTYLEDHHVHYDTLSHREAFTAHGVAAASHVSGWQLAKVVVVQPPHGHAVLAVLPASRRLDLGLLEELAGQAHLALASETEVHELFPDCETGAMPPLGNLYGLRVYVDGCFPHDREIVFQAGNHREVVRMAYQDFEDLVRPVVGEFCRR